MHGEPGEHRGAVQALGPETGPPPDRAHPCSSCSLRGSTPSATPSSLPRRPPDDPGFIDTILGSRAVVAAVRLAVISAGVFVVSSVVALTARGQWLTRVGPVQVAEQVSDMDAERQEFAKALERTDEIIDNLKQDLARTDDIIDRMERGTEGAE